MPPFCLAVTIVPSSRRPVIVEPLEDSYSPPTGHLLPRTLESILLNRQRPKPIGDVPPPFRLQ